ncbi:glycoside hydrolase family 20 protein [Hypoxylon sp. FL1857]|nr:glycoside hydrolase family 20 protein [Hypoxylon sp. FL1857]
MKVYLLPLLFAASLLATSSCSRLLTVPTAPFVTANSKSYDLRHLKSVSIDCRYGLTTDTEGETLIPPTLSEFARTFQEDFAESLGLNLSVRTGSLADAKDSIFITLDLEKGAYLDAAGRHSSEGYKLTVNDTGIIIAGVSPLGAWWGTRTVIQAAITNQLLLPYGSGVDAPGWATRGVMLDVRRHYYPPDFIVEMCSYLSFFKQNTFHLHLNDNLFINETIMTREQILSLYAAFRLWSDDPAVAGLNRRANESYTREVFESIQRKCAQRGVTVIPEIDLPTHALAVTMPTIKTIWKTFLPWFHSKRVDIGADEYIASEVAAYTRYVNELSDFGSNVNKNVSIQYWAPYLGTSLFDYIRNGYSVVNSDFAWYISEKWSAYFPNTLRKQLIFNGNPDGGQFSPNIFDTTNSSNNAARDDPLVEGHVAAAWNDFGPLTSTYLEAYYAWRDALPALADKQWGGNISEEEYDTIFDKLHAAIPAQNLGRAVPSRSNLIASYQFEGGAVSRVVDKSGNGYSATARGCTVKNGTLYLDGNYVLRTPLNNKGRNGILSFLKQPK